MVSALHIHLVIVTKYRRGVLRPEHLDLLENVFAKACSDFGDLAECTGEDDDVHLLIEHLPTVAISGLVNSLKGGSSGHLSQRFEMRTHRNHLWSPSYFAASASGAPLSTIRQYVETQRRPA